MKPQLLFWFRLLPVLCLFLLPLGLSGQDSAAGESVEPSDPVEEVTAAEEEAATYSLVEKLRESGKTGLALLVISIIGFSFAFERLFNLRRSKVTPDGLVGRAEGLWSAGDWKGLRKLAEDSSSALGRAIIEVLDHRRATHNEVSTLAGDVASREMRYHLQKAYPLAVVATISPLLGLFGTVYGMIGAFESVALAGEMGDPSIMAGDISYALITTAIGLVIAVPALAAYHFFRIRTNMLGLSLEEQLGHLISRWYGTKTDDEDGTPEQEA